VVSGWWSEEVGRRGEVPWWREERRGGREEKRDVSLAQICYEMSFEATMEGH
jgi:hypothetical protein